MTYTVGFSVAPDGKREMFIETDDLQALSGADWFREFLSLRKPQADVSAIITQLQQENSQMRQMLQQRQQAQQQQALPQQQARASTPIASGVPPQPPSPRRLPTSFLELVPEQMTPEIWNSLNPEQQAQWMKHYNLG